MRRLFRLCLSKPLRQLSLPRDSRWEVHGEAEEPQTGARCIAIAPSTSVINQDKRHLSSALQCLVLSTDLLQSSPD